ncbi:FG-GAP-like repeat-containing protein [Kitasatospora gansuensis]
MEDFAYPGAAQILAENHVTLKSGDGNIRLADCLSTNNLIEVFSRTFDAGSVKVCFRVTGPSGFLALELPKVYSIKGDDHAVKASLKTGSSSSSVDIKKNLYTPVGEGTSADGTTLLELNATDGPAAAADTASPYPAIGAVMVGQPGREGSRACSGTLVAPQWVLTAASCFAANGQPAAAGKPAVKTTVALGRSDLTKSGGSVVEAVELVPHADRDLMMVKLAWPIVGVDPVKVSSAAPVAGEQLTSVGFGRTKTEWLPSKLHSATFTVGSIDATSMGLNGSADAVACQGDAGGPALRMKGFLVELAAVNSRSWRGGCLGTDPAETRTDAVDVRTDGLGPWIGQIRQSSPEVRLQSLVPNVTSVMTTGDFNRDGRTDIASVTTDGNLHTFAGRPDGTFEYGRPLWKTDGSWNTAAKIIGGDFNGDGYTDIATVWNDGKLRLYAGRSDGSLADGKQMWVDDNFDWKGMLQLSRFKGDGSGRDGLLATWSAGNRGDLYAYTTGPDGVLNGSRQMWPDSSWQTMQKVATGDFNNDGRDDVVAIAGNGQLTRFSGSTTGGLEGGVAMWADTGWNGMPIVLAGDFNGDGNSDLGGLWSNQQRFNLYRGDGKGALAKDTNAWPSPSRCPPAA